MTSYNRALDYYPRGYWTWYRKGIVFEALGYYADAISRYAQAIACCAQLKNTNWAIASLEKAIDLYLPKYLELATNESIWQQFRQQIGFQSLLTNKSLKHQIDE